MAAATSVPGGPLRLDVETWQTQLEELLALQAVLDQDFSLLEAPGGGPACAAAAAACGQRANGGGASGRWLDPEALLMAGPPSEVCEGSSGGKGDGGGGSGGLFVAEALVHVDVPEGGLQLVLQMRPPPPAAPPPPPPQPPPGEQGTQHQHKQHQRREQGSEPLGQGHDRAGAGQRADGSGASTSGRGAGGRAASGPPGRAGERAPRGGRGGSGALRASHSKEAAAGGGDGGDGGDGASGTSRGNVGGGASGGGMGGSRDGAARGERGVPGGRGRGRGRDRGGHSGVRYGGPAGPSGVAQGAAPAHSTSPAPPPAPSPTFTSNFAPAPDSGTPSQEAASGSSAASGTAAPAMRPSSHEGRSRPAAGEPRVGFGARAGSSSSGALPESDGDTGPGPGPASGARPLGAEDPDPSGLAASPSPDGAPPPSAVSAAAAAPPLPPVLVPFGPPVHFLSPIRVTLTLPPNYPAASPPAVTLHALWLPPRQSAALAAALRSQWEAQGPGGPIAFLWLDWLRSEALSHLGLTQRLVLRDDEDGEESGGGGGGVAEGGAGAGEGSSDGGGGAAGAVGGGGGAEGLAVALLRYAARREQDKFNESTVSCAICLDQQLGSRCVRLPECRHAFCGACLATHLRTQLGQGQLEGMRCPDPGCRRPLPPYALQQLLEPDEYERWERLTLQRTLDKMEDLVYCPRCREPCLEEPDHSVLCPGCFFSFCALCEEPWHPGSACLDAEGRLALLEARRARHEEDGEGRSATERARRQLNRMNELKSLALLSATTKQCPQCSMGVEKTEGCNKMTCSYCGVFFCWRCNQVISGYDHFQQPAGQPGGCVLFEQEEIDRWNARWGGGAAGARAVQVEQRAVVANWLRLNAAGEVRPCRCVVCGQPNVKEGGNNDIRCWSCNSHFCYLCRTWLRNKPGLHFGMGPGRCRQHSDN